MTDLFLWLGLGAGEGHSLSEGSGIEAAGGGDERSSRFRFPSALRTDSPFGGSFDCAPGGAVLAGRFCGGASLRMTDLFLWLGLGAGEGHSLSEGSGIEAAGGGDERSSRFRFPSALRTDSPFGGSFDCAPGGAVLAGRFCGGASLRMTDLFLWLGLGAGEGHSLSEGSGIEAAGGGDERSSRFRFLSALRTDSPSGGPSTARRGAQFSLDASVAALRSG
jgi:hypothetical protein